VLANIGLVAAGSDGAAAHERAKQARNELTAKFTAITPVDADTARLATRFARRTNAAAGVEANVTPGLDATAAPIVVTAAAAAAVAALDPAALAEFVQEVLPVLRKYPDWNAANTAAVSRATTRAQSDAASTASSFSLRATDGGSDATSRVDATLSELGDARLHRRSTSAPPAAAAVAAAAAAAVTWKRRKHSAVISAGAFSLTVPPLPLNGIIRRRRWDPRTTPLSEFASAPGLFIPLGQAEVGAEPLDGGIIGGLSLVGEDGDGLLLGSDRQLSNVGGLSLAGEDGDGLSLGSDRQLSTAQPITAPTVTAGKGSTSLGRSVLSGNASDSYSGMGDGDGDGESDSHGDGNGTAFSFGVASFGASAIRYIL
jgi:hypothetical protein